MKNKALVEDRLDGASNFSSWKSRLQVTLEEDDLLDVVTKTLPDTATDVEKKIRKEEDVKARKLIIYSVRDHLLPRIANLKTTYDMYEALKEMFESDNTLRALTLKSQLQSTKMTKGDTVSIFFMKLSEIKEQLETIGEIMSDRELVLTTLNNLPKTWEPFLQSISGREALPTFDHLWTDCTQEELRLRNRGVEDSSEENHALALHTKKGGKFKRNFRKHLKVKSLHQIQVIKEEMFQKFSASDVTIMDTMQETVQPGRREDNMLPPLTLIQTHLKRMKRRERRSTSSKTKA
jgi:hypothetical protein